MEMTKWKMKEPPPEGVEKRFRWCNLSGLSYSNKSQGKENTTYEHERAYRNSRTNSRGTGSSF
jgi:hypothetical protein